MLAYFQLTYFSDLGFVAIYFLLLKDFSLFEDVIGAG
jgi:hypothetical protein